jgi:hypothetical protein
MAAQKRPRAHESCTVPCPDVSSPAELHEDASLAGFVAVSTLPELSAATHSVAELQASPKISFPGSIPACVVHPGPDPVGSLEVIIDVDATANDGFSIPTHNVLVGHEIAASGPATDVDFQSVATVVVGFVVAKIRPPEPVVGWPIATHIVADAHEIADSPPVRGPGFNDTVLHTALAPSAGSVELSIDPSSLTATQSVVVGHEIPLNG